jgi:transcriptional regulator with XRE-family HTH domain
MNIGLAVKKARELKNITLDDLALYCGLSKSYLSLLENNHRGFRLSTLNNISKSLNIPLPVMLFLGLGENEIKELPSGLKKEFDKLLIKLIKV